MPKKPYFTNFSDVQKALCGVAIAFYAIYKLWLKDNPSIKEDLGSIYPYLMQVWVLIMIFSAGFSGWQLVAYLPNPKTLLKKKEEPDIGPDNENEIN